MRIIMHKTILMTHNFKTSLWSNLATLHCGTTIFSTQSWRWI